MTIDDLEHVVDSAIYAGGPSEPYYQPVLTCACGWSSQRCPNWATAGEAMDAHLEEVDDGE